MIVTTGNRKRNEEISCKTQYEKTRSLFYRQYLQNKHKGGVPICGKELVYVYVSCLVIRVQHYYENTSPL